MLTLGLLLFIAVALIFDFTNGFHDASSAVAVSITTRALTPLAALGMAAGLNVIGALVSTKVATTVGSGIIATPTGKEGLLVVFAALLGAIGWNLVTWWFGLPSSSTHALIGGLVGAALASSGPVKWSGVVGKVIVPMAVSPLVGIALSFILMLGILWAFRRARSKAADGFFRRAQVVSSGAMAFSHGTQDAQKTMGVIALALVTTGHLKGFSIPVWVILAAAAAMGLGTLVGGWRLIRTVGNRITRLDAPRGFAAQASASAVLLVSAANAIPLSTTHVQTGTVMGVGAARRVSAVRWGVARRVMLAWVLTLPGAAVCAAVVYLIADIFI